MYARGHDWALPARESRPHARRLSATAVELGSGVPQWAEETKARRGALISDQAKFLCSSEVQLVRTSTSTAPAPAPAPAPQKPKPAACSDACGAPLLLQLLSNVFTDAGLDVEAPHR